MGTYDALSAAAGLRGRGEPMFSLDDSRTDAARWGCGVVFGVLGPALDGVCGARLLGAFFNGAGVGCDSVCAADAPASTNVLWPSFSSCERPCLPYYR